MELRRPHSSLPVWLPITLTSTGTAALSWYPSWGIDTATGAVTLPTYRLTGAQSGRCLDISGVSQVNGAITQIWDCNGGPNQSFAPNTASELRVYGNKCLQARNQGTSAGTAVEIWDCTGGVNQKWMLSSDGSIIGVQSRLCLDVNGRPRRTAAGCSCGPATARQTSGGTVADQPAPPATAGLAPPATVGG